MVADANIQRVVELIHESKDSEYARNLLMQEPSGWFFYQ